MGLPGGRIGSRLPGLVAVLAAVVLSSSGSQARDLTGAEHASLAARVRSFDDAMRAKDIPTIIDVVPPRVVAHIAKTSGVPQSKLREVMIAQTGEVMKSAIVKSFGMDLGQARHESLPGGKPYVLIPTQVAMEIGDQKVAAESRTLALMDNGIWYLLDLNQPSRVSIFTRVYPEFAGVEFGGQTTKATP